MVSIGCPATRAASFGVAAVLLATFLVGCARTTSGSGVASAPFAPEDENKDQADADRVRARLTALRAKNRRSPALPFPVGDMYLAMAKRRIIAGRDPWFVLDDLMQGAADEGGRDVYFWSVQARDVEELRMPADLVTHRALHVAIAVMRRRGLVEEEKGDYLVLFAMSMEGLGQTAPLP
jgi:hypothetical protein